MESIYYITDPYDYKAFIEFAGHNKNMMKIVEVDLTDKEYYAVVKVVSL